MIKLLICVLATLLVSSNACKGSHKETEILTIATYHRPNLCTTYCYSNCVVAANQHGSYLESYSCEQPYPYNNKNTVCECTLSKCYDI